MSREITRFDGEYRFLSNFWLCEVSLGGLIYPSSEHAFQAQKSLHLYERARVMDAPTPGDAKRMGRSLTLRPGWDVFRKQAMLTVLVAKFTQNPDLGERLVSTEDVPLEEGNHWHDNYWGACSCSRCAGGGLNYLGRLLMAVRDVVRVD